MMLSRQRRNMMIVLGSVLSLIFIPVAAAGNDTGKSISLTRLAPDQRGGQAYRLVYQVPLPLKVFWRFKTDFDNHFLEQNKYILKHRLISRDGDVVVTEDIYSTNPSERFHWQTRIVAEDHRLEFELLDTKAHNHKFHYGVIKLKPVGNTTKVTQTAYFDFLGASLWAIYPWSGGMQAFLKYTANWERETAVRLRHRYMDQPSKNTSAPEQMKK